jgi:hypothetical protein
LTFGNLFKENFSRIPNLKWNNKPTENKKVKNKKSWFHNFVINRNGFVIIGLDWVNRKVSKRGANLHYSVKGGTFQWLQKTLQDLKKDKKVKQIVFFQHHPFKVPEEKNYKKGKNGKYIKNSKGEKAYFRFSFNKSQISKIINLLKKEKGDKEKYWGVFAGHVHRHFYEPIFQRHFKSFKQFETNCGVNSRALTIVNVKDSKISSIEYSQTKYPINKNKTDIEINEIYNTDPNVSQNKISTIKGNIKNENESSYKNENEGSSKNENINDENIVSKNENKISTIKGNNKNEEISSKTNEESKFFSNFSEKNKRDPSKISEKSNQTQKNGKKRISKSQGISIIINNNNN